MGHHILDTKQLKSKPQCHTLFSRLFPYSGVHFPCTLSAHDTVKIYSPRRPPVNYVELTMNNSIF